MNLARSASDGSPALTTPGIPPSSAGIPPSSAGTGEAGGASAAFSSLASSFVSALALASAGALGAINPSSAGGPCASDYYFYCGTAPDSAIF